MRDENASTIFHLVKFNFHPLIIALLLSISIIFICGCRSGASLDEGTRSEINVAAAANLTDAFNELGKEFTSRTGIRVVYSFGATADLSKQIEQGAPFDVFASADVEHVEGLNNKKLLVSDTAAIYARGRLVLWIPAGSRVSISRIEDVTQSGVERIAVAKPDVAPYGRATIEALKSLNIWQVVEPRVVYGQNVLQVKQYAATGNADVAFIPLALVKQGEGRAIEISENLHQPINQMIAVVRASAKEDAARRFVSYVLSAEGQALLERYGYRKP
jgi:molybdate transport system substrate-binding protein